MSAKQLIKWNQQIRLPHCVTSPHTHRASTGSAIKEARTARRSSASKIHILLATPSSPKMSKPVIFVIGSSGNIGSATLQALSDKYAGKFDIRAGVRNPDKADKLKAMAGVTVVQATQGDKDNLVGVFKGVDALYIIAPRTENRAELVIKTAEAAKAAGVNFLLILSLPTAELSDPGFGRQFKEIESAVVKLNVPHAFLRLPYFMENYWSLKDTIQSQGSIYYPVDPSKPFTAVVADDAGKAGAAVLTDWQKHVNKIYTIVSDCHSFDDAVKAFSDTIGKEITFVRVSYDAAKQSMLQGGVPEWQVEGSLGWFKLIDSDSPATNQANQDFERLTGEKPTSLRAWLAKVGGAFK